MVIVDTVTVCFYCSFHCLMSEKNNKNLWHISLSNITVFFAITFPVLQTLSTFVDTHV